MKAFGYGIILFFLTACSPASTDPWTRHIVDDSLPIRLSDTLGNSASGESLFVQRETGHCILCHKVETLEAPFQGNIGPDLSQVGLRLSPAQIRLRIVNYDTVKPGTLMPPYYTRSGLQQVQSQYRETTVLTAQQVEDLVAYLSGLGHNITP